MKVYFAASLRGKKFYENYYRKIYRTIEELGYTHIDKLLLETSVNDFYKKLESGGYKAHIDFYYKTIKNIKKGEINIFECSFPSLGIGSQVEQSLQLEKPTIILYLKNHIPHYIEGAMHDRLIIRKYSQKNLKIILQNALKEAKKYKEKRFNFFISPKILSYLDQRSKTMEMTKSTFVRGLIIEDIKKNKTKQNLDIIGQ